MEKSTIFLIKTRIGIIWSGVVNTIIIVAEPQLVGRRNKCSAPLILRSVCSCEPQY